MLKLRPNCQCCDVDLPPNGTNAYICSYECTFCTDCATNVFDRTCPNCGGELIRRPARLTEHLNTNPGATERFMKTHPQGAHLPAQIRLKG